MEFYKYQGTGNDFILFDNRNGGFDRSRIDLVAKLCDRRFGIGADGLMLLQNKEGFDFEMIYYNSDGNESSMCGNGGRCIVAFASFLGLVKDEANFIATDGPHVARLTEGLVNLKMNDVGSIEKNAEFSFLDTGSPHYVKYVENVQGMDVNKEGALIRNNERFKAEGTNVNFIENTDDALFVRTFERGVEGETYSCGTGVTAAALVNAMNNKNQSQGVCKIKTLGGNLTVRYQQNETNNFSNIWLEGPATFVFKGNVEL